MVHSQTCKEGSEPWIPHRLDPVHAASTLVSLQLCCVRTMLCQCWTGAQQKEAWHRRSLATAAGSSCHSGLSPQCCWGSSASAFVQVLGSQVGARAAAAGRQQARSCGFFLWWQASTGVGGAALESHHQHCRKKPGVCSH